MRIMGIDPGYAIVGWGMLDYQASRFKMLEYGAVTTPAGLPIADRLEMIYRDLSLLFDRFSPDGVAVEQLFFNTNHTTAIAVAMARGVILLCAKQHNVELFEYTPLQIKQAVTGYGKAVKKQVMEMTRMILNLEEIPKPDDAADALAVAICHAHSAGSLMSRLKQYEAANPPVRKKVYSR